MSIDSARDTAQSPAGGARVPPLEPGDRLTRPEFERRYEATPDLKKAELIEGVVCMPAAVRFRHHSQPHSDLIAWLGTYRARTPGVLAGDNASARLDLDNMPQPDAMLLIDPECGGQARISDDDYVEEAPELVGEISSSSVSFDLHTKRNVYRRSGVREYIVWRVSDMEIDWFTLRGGEYVKQAPDQAGQYRSEVFPGLWLDAAAMIKGDLARVLDVIQEGTRSAGHREFIERLAEFHSRG